MSSRHPSALDTESSNLSFQKTVILNLIQDPDKKAWIPASAGMTNKNRMSRKTYYVYILASRRNGTIYTGVTNDLRRRVWEHKHDLVKGFTKEYGVHNLVYYELTEDIDAAILREKQIKAWKRKWKLALIEKENPNWEDLYQKII